MNNPYFEIKQFINVAEYVVHNINQVNILVILKYIWIHMKPNVRQHTTIHDNTRQQMVEN